MKALIIVDISNDVSINDLTPIQTLFYRKDSILDYVAFREKMVLKHLPEKKENTIINQGEIDVEIPIDFLNKVYYQGYNECIDEILREDDE